MTMVIWSTRKHTKHLVLKYVASEPVGLHKLEGLTLTSYSYKFNLL